MAPEFLVTPPTPSCIIAARQTSGELISRRRRRFLGPCRLKHRSPSLRKFATAEFNYPAGGRAAGETACRVWKRVPCSCWARLCYQQQHRCRFTAVPRLCSDLVVRLLLLLLLLLRRRRRRRLCILFTHTCHAAFPPVTYRNWTLRHSNEVICPPLQISAPGPYPQTVT